MSYINLIFDIYGYVPKWINGTFDLYQNILRDSRYRIYVNNDLIVERNWLWDNNIFLRENIYINSAVSEYTLKLEPVIFHKNQIKFLIKNLKVNDKLLIIDTEQLELSFKV